MSLCFWCWLVRRLCGLWLWAVSTHFPPTDHHETRQPPCITYSTLTIGNTNAANTRDTIQTTTNPTNDGPRCRHLQHPYHHHHDPGTK